MFIAVRSVSIHRQAEDREEDILFETRVLLFCHPRKGGVAAGFYTLPAGTLRFGKNYRLRKLHSWSSAVSLPVNDSPCVLPLVEG